MAATDQFYRKQKTLDIVFGVSCILMLLSLIGMFVQDQVKEWKDDQRKGYDVEEAMAQRAALMTLPEMQRIKEAEAAVQKAQEELPKEQIQEIRDRIKDKRLLPAMIKAETDYQAKKADYDSQMSLVNIAREHRNAIPEKDSRRKSHDDHVAELEKKLATLKAEMDALLRRFEEAKKAYEDAQADLAKLQKPLTDALANLKKLNTEFDRFTKLASQKSWGWGAGFRNLPILDAFNAPVRIHQFTLEELPIEYGSFKYVTRYDRCMSCHIAIDRPAYTRQALADLKDAPSDLQAKLDEARETLKTRQQLIRATGDQKLIDANEDFLKLELGKLRQLELSEKFLSEFSAHPRLDLFVDDNSPHPKEKFGCTSCHSGQGSATSFNLASHTPDDARTHERWVKDYGWASHHYWDFPMLPRRFVESGCVKCHHQVTDLIRDGSRNEAPKLLRGYNLVKDNGCFGCHEIAGIKGSRSIGPDMRLEPWPALDDLNPAEQVKAKSDPLNPPGTMRKVGPSLRRLSEKTHEDWVRKWIRDPRGFRPDTKMPHFYGLSNNTPEALAGSGQEKFPDAEIHAVGYYLMQASRSYVNGQDPYRESLQARIQELEEKVKTSKDAKDQRDLEETKRRLQLYPVPTPLAKSIVLDGGAVVQLPDEPKEDKARQEQTARGRQLFSERGCLACHSHQGTQTAGLGLPPAQGEAQFGPNLSRLTAKLGSQPGDRASARRWLVQWVLNPYVHHPRSFMPITHLTVDQAADVAAWILDQKAEGWKEPEVPPPSEDTLKGLARVWLEKSRTQQEVEDLFSAKEASKTPSWLRYLRADSDERVFQGGVSDHALKMYVGKKAVNQLGCYACHDIPGFETTKPIGTPLNEWGKKDAERLAFEDIGAFVDKHYQRVKKLGDTEDVFGHALHYDQGKAPYEEFYHNELAHRTRVGFLNQKLNEPRSYDYQRIRKWDERLRMPQFKFARTDRRAGESDTEFQVRADKEEAEGREAVMTFILGLVAEPIPAKYLNNPGPDRMAEVKGRQVLDKYNCFGCHQVRAGVYEVKNTPEVRRALEGFYQTASSKFATDHFFANHNAWVGRPPQPDRLKLFAVPERQKLEGAQLLRLTDALRFTNPNGQTRDIPAEGTIGIGKEDGLIPPDQVVEGKTYGGTFADLMVSYLTAKNKVLYNTDKDALAALPPPLLREGEKAQPEWLFRFLRNPHEIRPLTVLRMPRFNMSDDEAMALVNYFAAADKLSNPGIGLEYPYQRVEQRDDAYWQKQSRAYVERLKKHGLYDKRVAELKPIWEQVVKDERAEFASKIAIAETGLKAAKTDEEKKVAQQALDTLKKQRDALSADAQRKDWEERQAYASDAYRMLANYNNICRSCHAVGNLPGKEAKGPNLDLAWERLRPEWSLEWLANPNRLLSYDSIMPANFPRNRVDKHGWSENFSEFLGTPLEQAAAVRDVFMNLPRVSEMPANRYYRAPQAAEGSK